MEGNQNKNEKLEVVSNLEQKNEKVKKSIDNNEIKHEINEKALPKKSPTPFEITVLILFIIFVIIWAFNRDKISNFLNDNNIIQTQTEKKEVDKTFIVYNENNLLVKITNYEYKYITDRIKVTYYIENNSDIETTFAISKDVSINDCMVNGGHLYEVVKPHSKTIKEVSIYDLEKYNLNEDNIKEMKFNFDIYRSEHYIIKNRLLDNQEFIYTFNN